MSKNNEGDLGTPGSSARQSSLRGRALLGRRGTTASPGRLPTLRPARDLTLGGSPKLNLTTGSQAKRVYSPNIPSRRVKEELKGESSHEPKNERHQGKRQDRGRGRGRGRGGRGKPDLVSSSSVFSLGPSQKAGHQAQASSSHAAVGIGGGSSRPTVRKEGKDEWDEEESNKVLKMLQDTGDDDEDGSQEDGMRPVQLPLSSNAPKNSKEQKLEPEDSADIHVKTEVGDLEMEDVDNRPVKTSKPIKQVTKAMVEEVTCDSLFSSHLTDGEERLIFFQFPDALPIKKTEEDETMNVEQPTGEQAATDKKSSKHSLEDVSEGYIGKLQVLKSGKTRLLLGGVSLDVTMGTPCAFLQPQPGFLEYSNQADLVSVHTEEERSDMMVLGHVRHRLSCTPDFEELVLKTS